MVEAELKALVRDPDRIHAVLSARAVGERSIYFDRYLDYPDRGWIRQGYELRVRTVTDELGRTRVVLTYKEPVVDHASGSKPEHETAIENADALVTVLTALGVEQIIAFEKRCVNYRFTTHGRDLLATVVTVPELVGQTFIELETLTDPGDVHAALRIVRSVLRELGIEDSDPPPRTTPTRSRPDDTPGYSAESRPRPLSVTGVFQSSCAVMSAMCRAQHHAPASGELALMPALAAVLTSTRSRRRRSCTANVPRRIRHVPQRLRENHGVLQRHRRALPGRQCGRVCRVPDDDHPVPSQLVARDPGEPPSSLPFGDEVPERRATPHKMGYNRDHRKRRC